MFTQLATSLAFVSVVVAQTTSLWLMGFDQQSIEGSVIASDATATTYSLNCPSGVDSGDCGIPTSFTFTQGPSTVAYSYVADNTDATETFGLACQVTSSISGVCVVTAEGAAPSGTGGTIMATTSSFSGTADLGLMAVTLTAGVAASTGATETSSSDSTATGISSASKATDTISKATTSSKASRSASGTATGAVSSSSSKAAAPLITKAPWVAVMGVGALALAALR